ncbi:hypothetical protein N9M01_13285 [Luminiphilus sp.]|nr:hypothetical protein [Luminiphilus sp.]MDA8825853.1 hypothetical protein [Luminiphilus sp.]
MILNWAKDRKAPPCVGTKIQRHRLRFMGFTIVHTALLLSLSMFVVADDPRVEMSARLIPAEGAVPGQRIKLEVTVATPRWFTAGTRIKLPEVPGLLLLQNQDFAANASERRNGETWTVQRWFIDVFATKPGTVIIPPLGVSVSVSKSTQETVASKLNTEPLTVTTHIPPELADLKDWVASPSVTLVQTVEGSLDTYLGSAINRRITLKAQDVMAMLLPQTTSENDPLLQMYPEPPVLRNRSNRGNLTATRSDKISWIAAAPGTVEIPGVAVNWWNTDTQTLEILTTEPLSISISGELPPKPVSSTETLEALFYAAATLFIGFLGWRLIASRRFSQLRKRGEALLRTGRRLATQLKGSSLPHRLNPWRNAKDSDAL